MQPYLTNKKRTNNKHIIFELSFFLFLFCAWFLIYCKKKVVLCKCGLNEEEGKERKGKLLLFHDLGHLFVMQARRREGWDVRRR